MSLVIPAYNEEAYLPSCLAHIEKRLSGWEHDAHDIEVVVVNNASTDKTREVAASFPWVRIIDEPTKGLVYARRAGFVATTGDIVANIDADTLLPEGWLQTVMREFSQDNKLVGLSGPFVLYDAPRSTRALGHLFYVVAYIAYILNRFVFRSGSMLQGGNFVVRRTAIEQIGGFDTTIEFYGEDSDIARRLHRAGKVKWTFALPMYASGRRLAHEGAVRAGVRYGLNYIWIHLFKRPLTKTHTDVRVRR